MQIAFEYPFMNDVMRVVKDSGATVVAQDFTLDCSMTLRIRRSQIPHLQERLGKVESLRFVESEPTK